MANCRNGPGRACDALSNLQKASVRFVLLTCGSSVFHTSEVPQDGKLFHARFKVSAVGQHRMTAFVPLFLTRIDSCFTHDLDSQAMLSCARLSAFLILRVRVLAFLQRERYAHAGMNILLSLY